MRDQQKYPSSFTAEILEDWDYNLQGPHTRSMTQFCRDWNVPRSTFSGWLREREPLPADRFYMEPSSPAEPTVAYFTCGKPTADVLRMLASELSAIASDLNEIVNEL